MRASQEGGYRLISTGEAWFDAPIGSLSSLSCGFSATFHDCCRYSGGSISAGVRPPRPPGKCRKGILRSYDSFGASSADVQA